jgi:hypothetical protein
MDVGNYRAGTAFKEQLSDHGATSQQSSGRPTARPTTKAPVDRGERFKSFLKSKKEGTFVAKKAKKPAKS